MKRLEEVFHEALQALGGYDDEVRDPEYETEELASADTAAEQLMEALGLSADQVGEGTDDSPMQKHAEIAVPKLKQLSTYLPGDPLRSAVAVVPVLEEMSSLTVTRKTLGKALLPVLAALRPYRRHDDPVVSMQTKQVLGAWKQIYEQGLRAETLPQTRGHMQRHRHRRTQKHTDT